MSIRIPLANTNNPIARNFVSQMAKDGFLPVIALEAFVEGGRTYQAYKRGGFDEARERITEEFSGAIFWLGGVTALNWVFEKLGQKLLKLPNKVVDTASDTVRNPLGNYLNSETTKKGEKILEKTMARFKFAKVIASVLVANSFIGFVLPKINQGITRWYHRNKPVQDNTPAMKTYNPRPTFDTFTNDKDNNNKKDVAFGINLLSLANKFENDRNYKLLSVDAGTASGRAISARNNDERVEILFRDLGSIYFYMFNMVNMNTWLNKLEQNGNSKRLDPTSAEFATKYMQSYIKDKNQSGRVNYKDFEADMLGRNMELPQSLKAKFEGKGIKIISLDKFKNELRLLVPEERFTELNAVADKMSELQPKIKGMSILTEAQAKDILNGGHINNPEFLMEFFKNRFGTKFTEKYKFVAQNDLDSKKAELLDFVKSIIERAKKTDSGEITVEMLQKASNHNLKMNAINWGAGFVTSALFLSTIIPKLQYQITKWRTGSNEFPGTKQYRQQG